jgi:hypothetical protein
VAKVVERVVVVCGRVCLKRRGVFEGVGRPLVCLERWGGRWFI